MADDLEVVDTVCAACHATGKNGAPKIGDQQAWAGRTAQGLTALTDHALTGVRNMPSHGGNAALSDSEIESAITYMVNQSGGHWIEPLGGATPAMLRSSEQIVQSKCIKCHEQGIDGAPKLGDRPAWTARLKKGLSALTKSALHGRGGMPSGGGYADLSDLEIQGAVMYMFNYGLATAPLESGVRTEPNSSYRKVIDGLEIYLGVADARAMELGPWYTRIFRGKADRHVSISVFDVKTKLAITDALVKVRVADPMELQSKTLDVVAINNTASYGAFFRMDGMLPYVVTAQIKRPGSERLTEAVFEYKVINQTHD